MSGDTVRKRPNRLVQSEDWRPSPPPKAVTKTQAAAMLSMSVETFNRHVLPHIRIVRLGRESRVSLRELDRYLDDHAALTLDADGTGV